MKILIAGIGTIGHHLTHALVREGIDVVVIDPDDERLGRLRNNVDCQAVAGSALDPEVLENIGIRSVDMLVAVTDSDPINMSITQLASFYGVPKKFARIRNPAFTKEDSIIPSSHFGIDKIISPEAIMVDYIDKIVRCPGTKEAFDFEDGRLAIRAMSISEESPFVGESLIYLRQNLEGDYLVAALHRGAKVIIPTGDDILRVGDTVCLICGPEMLPILTEAFDPTLSIAKKAIIFGAGMTGIQLAKKMYAQGIFVQLLEQDEKIAEKAAIALDKENISVLCGSASDLDLLQRMHVENVDYFIALSDNDESNLTGALLFRRYGGGRVIIQCNQSHYVDILDSLDFDVIVNPRFLAVSSILRYIRRGNIISGFKVMGGANEILEIEATPKSKVIKKELKDLVMPKGVIIVAVMRQGQLHIPGGTFQIQSQDRVFLFTDGNGSQKAEKLF